MANLLKKKKMYAMLSEKFTGLPKMKECEYTHHRSSEWLQFEKVLDDGYYILRFWHDCNAYYVDVKFFDMDCNLIGKTWIPYHKINNGDVWSLILE